MKNLSTYLIFILFIAEKLKTKNVLNFWLLHSEVMITNDHSLHNKKTALGSIGI